TICGVAWRVMLRRWYQGVLLILGLALTISAPFLLPLLGLMSPTYVIHDDVVVIHPQLHHFPPIATLVTLVLTTIGVVAFAVLFGRVYAQEIRRVEERLTFQAWQVRQLVPSRRD